MTKTKTKTKTKTNREIADMLGQLGHDERELAEYVVEGLLEGRRSYGELDLDRDQRDWHDEAAQEHRDAIVYLACAAIARRRAKARVIEPVDADGLWRAKAAELEAALLKAHARIERLRDHIEDGTRPTSIGGEGMAL